MAAALNSLTTLIPLTLPKTTLPLPASIVFDTRQIGGGYAVVIKSHSLLLSVTLGHWLMDLRLFYRFSFRNCLPSSYALRATS